MSSPLRILTLLFCGTLCLSCSERSPDAGVKRVAVTEGTPALGDEAVVAIGWRRVGCEDLLQVTCTGTLIAPRVVLTAAHCVDERSELEVFFGADVSEEGSYAGVSDAMRHPDFDDETNANDLALLVLDRVAPAEPVAMVASPIDASFEGRTARIVGFGLTGPKAGDVGTKREGTSLVSSVAEESFVIVPGPSMTCQADSGGPVFVQVEGEERLAGVTSWGDLQCSADGVNMQVGAYRASFVDPFLATVGDVPDASVAPDPGPLCEASCNGDDDCPSGMSCAQGGMESRCVLAPLPPGSFEGACDRDDECSEQCVRVPWSESCRCFTPCGGSVIPPRQDAGLEAGLEAGKATVRDIVDYGAFGGCSTSGSRRRPSSAYWFVTALLALGLAGRRSRSR